MLDSNEMFALSIRGELRKRVEALSVLVGLDTVQDDMLNLAGGIDEHVARFTKAQACLVPTDDCIRAMTKIVVVALKDSLVLPAENTPDEPLDSRVARLAVTISDADILAALQANWSFIAGFDVVKHVYYNP